MRHPKHHRCNTFPGSKALTCEDDKVNSIAIRTRAFQDKNGSAFDGAATYRFAVPPNVPVTLYWSATAYDRATHTSSETRPGPADPRTHPVLRPTTTDQ